MKGYAAVGLDHPKNSINVGSALRAAENYGAVMLALTGRRFKRVPTDTLASWRRMPVIETEDLHLVIPYDCVPVAIELVPGSQSLVDYQHPERAFYIFGPEDGSLGKRVLGRCRDVVSIPTHNCMNLAATVNVVLYDRMAKAMR